MPSLHRVLSLLTHCVLKPCVNRFAVSQQCYPLNQCPLQSPFPVQSPVKSHQAITLIPSLNSAPQQKTVKNKRITEDIRRFIHILFIFTENVYYFALDIEDLFGIGGSLWHFSLPPHKCVYFIFCPLKRLSVEYDKRTH